VRQARIKKYGVSFSQGVVAEEVQASLSQIEAVYRREFPRFVHVATAITSDVELAADAVQDGFARAIRLRRSYRGTGSLEGWLWRIVVNAARDRAGTKLASTDAAPEATAAPSASDPSEVRTLLAKLPERQRLVLFLRYYADLDYDAIATALEISSGTVGATLHAAHTTLRAQIQEVRC
jgi:RNA polymerase sigma factor (sigma-70 family)